jgi:AraC-like DNA-binding protein
MTVDVTDRDLPFAADMTRVDLGRCEVVSPNSSPAIIRHSTDTSGVDAFNLQVQHSGRSFNRTGGHECELNPGDFVLFDPARPHFTAFKEATQVIIVRLPMAEVEARLPGLEKYVGLHMRGDQGGGAMLSSFLRNSWTHLQEISENDWANSLPEVIWTLIEVAYQPARRAERLGDAVTRGSRWRQEARAYIDERLCDPELDVTSVAQALGVSPRYVQMLFAEEATTPSTYILERRLERAAERLGREGLRQTITEIAFSVGFNDLSYFCRAFRKRFGAAPRDYRAAGGRTRHPIA